jgi:hypothetical protein
MRPMTLIVLTWIMMFGFVGESAHARCRKYCRGRVSWRHCAPARACSRPCCRATTGRCPAAEAELQPRKTYGFVLPMAPAPAEMEEYGAASPSDLEPGAAAPAGAAPERTLEIDPNRPGGAK